MAERSELRLGSPRNRKSLFYCALYFEAFARRPRVLRDDDQRGASRLELFFDRSRADRELSRTGCSGNQASETALCRLPNRPPELGRTHRGRSAKCFAERARSTRKTRFARMYPRATPERFAA